MLDKLKRFSRSKSFQFGFPMLFFIVLGSFGLAEFTSIRVRKRDEKVRMLTSEEMLELTKGSKTTLEQEYKKLQEEMDLDDWSNKRGPRIWEEETLKQLPTYTPKAAE